MNLKKSRMLSFATSLLVIGSSFVGLTATAANAASAPITVTFESNDTSGASLGGAADFGGNVSSVIDSTSGANTSKVGKLVNGGECWSGTTFLIKEVGYQLVSDVSKIVTVDVYSQDPIAIVKLKLEGGPADPAREVDVAHPGGGWKNLSFDFATGAPFAPGNYIKASIFAGFTCGGGTKPAEALFDNASFPGATNPDVIISRTTPSVLVNFENNDTSGYTLTSFGDAVSSKVTDSEAQGSSGSTSALKLVDVGACWAGTTFLNAGAKVSLVSAAHPVVKANIYAPAAGKVIKLKIEDSTNGGRNKEIDLTSMEGWNTYSFDFSGFDANVDYNIASIFVNFTCGGGSKDSAIWYVDDIAFNGATGAVIPGAVTPVLVNFESFDTTGYNLISFGDSTSSKASDAPYGGSVASTSALKLIDAGQCWAGTTFLSTTDSLLGWKKSVVKANIYAPAAGKVIKLKLENAANGDLNKEVDVTSVEGWNTYTFDFAGFNTGVSYNKASIFVDFTCGGGAKDSSVWYVDDIAFLGASGAALSPTIYNVRLADWNATNSFDGTHVWGDGGLGVWFDQYTGYYAHYVVAGSTFNVRYKVTKDSNGANAPDGTVVTLQLGTAWSNSNAKFKVGDTVIAGATIWGANGQEDQGSVTATVQNGYVTVSMQSTDTMASATENPGSATANPDALGPKFMQVKTKVMGNAVTHQDWVNLIVTQPVAAASISSVSATYGKSGQAIDIVGTNLQNDATGSSVVLYTPATRFTDAVTTPVTVLAISEDGTRMTIASPAINQKGYLIRHNGSGAAPHVKLYSASSTAAVKPSISMPTSLVQAAGSTFTLNGFNLASASSISIGSLNASFAILSANSVLVTVPAGAVSGSTISATNAAGTTTSSKLVYVPAVVASTTAAARVGQTVTVTGSNLTGAKVVFGGNKSAQPVTNNGSTLTVVVPAGAVSGAIKITTAAGVVYTAAFTVTPPAPTVTSFTPATGKKGVAIITVRGTNLSGATVTVGTKSVTLRAGATSTSFSFVIPASAVTGKINITTAGGTVSSATNLTVTK